MRHPLGVNLPPARKRRLRVRYASEALYSRRRLHPRCVAASSWSHVKLQARTTSTATHTHTQKTKTKKRTYESSHSVGRFPSGGKLRCARPADWVKRTLPTRPIFCFTLLSKRKWVSHGDSAQPGIVSRSICGSGKDTTAKGACQSQFGTAADRRRCSLQDVM